MASHIWPISWPILWPICRPLAAKTAIENPWNLDRLTKAVAKVRDYAGIAHVDPETGQRRTKHLHDARGTFATKLMLTGKLTDQEIAGLMGWSATSVSRIRHVYVDQTAIVVAIGERINPVV